MTAEELTARAKVAYDDPVYGQAWQETLRALCDVDPKTVRRWLYGGYAVPGAVSAMVKAHHKLYRLGFNPLTGAPL